MTTQAKEATPPPRPNTTRPRILVTEAPPDLIVLDMHMPGVDGLGVIRAVREALGDPKVPIIILSGSADEETQAAAMRRAAL